ncbi:hypothetical protein FDP22_21900 (plasmid) [Paroceanicella profunda]|uniref:Aldehyde oxidase/xanthine dehydrogenase a/b hammerhead domain-containing protein n=1 Tax=Paroceanicella profunda TaxID=2579971 RepID=A0A5B8G6G6_9RHOB|nr:xanthine dehydrogenase family protein [Paroceanicella profunda]QDL94683.1 hypothetical protein FDP22_21900 [Paroceanicella profunda]
MPADRTLIGASAPRASARRTVEGLGRYTDDLDAAGAAHVAFLRSPHAHARILATELDEARAAPGVTGVYTAQHLAAVCGPWQTRLAALPRHVSPPQQALAGEIVRYQGEPVVAVLAESRRAAESALELAWVEFEDLDPAILPPDIFEPGFDPAAWEPQQALDRSIAYGDAAAALAGAAHVVRHRFSFGRQTAVSLEGRAVDAGFDRRTGRLTVHQSHQAPFQMQQIYADLFGLPLGRVQVIAPDVGGAFGGKLHALPDEIAAVALAVLTGRRVKFTADRLESFLADAHAREAQAEARLGVDAEGRILGLEIEFAAGLGAYSIYPRGSVGDALQAIQLAPAAYRVPHYAARARAWFQNKAPVGAYRGVGQPIAFAIMEQMLDMAAAACGLDPAEMRRRNYRAAPETPGPTETGVVLESLTTRACLDMLLAEMDYAGLRAEQAALRAEGVYRASASPPSSSSPAWARSSTGRAGARGRTGNLPVEPGAGRQPHLPHLRHRPGPGHAGRPRADRGRNPRRGAGGGGDDRGGHRRHPSGFFNHLSSGEADLGIYFDGRTWNHYDSGAEWIDFINPEEGGSLNGVAVQIPKNADRWPGTT